MGGLFHQPAASLTAPSLMLICFDLFVHLIQSTFTPLRLLLTSPLALWNVSLCTNLYTNRYVYLCIEQSVLLKHKACLRVAHSVGTYINVSRAGSHAPMSAYRDSGREGWLSMHDSTCSWVSCIPDALAVVSVST